MQCRFAQLGGNTSRGTAHEMVSRRGLGPGLEAKLMACPTVSSNLTTHRSATIGVQNEGVPEGGTVKAK